MVAVRVEAMDQARSVPVRHPDVAGALEPLFVHGRAAGAVVAHHARRRFRLSARDWELDQDLAVEGHLEDSGWTRFDMDALTEDGCPHLVAHIRADLEDEARVAHPEEL